MNVLLAQDGTYNMYAVCHVTVPCAHVCVGVLPFPWPYTFFLHYAMTTGA